MKIEKQNESYIILYFDPSEDKHKKKITNALSIIDERLRWTPKVRAGFSKPIRYFFRENWNSLVITTGIYIHCISLFPELFPPIEVEKIDDTQLKQFINSLKLPYILRDYQYEMVKDSIERKKIVFESCTGSGKSISIYVVLSYLIKIKNLRGALVVPNLGLIKQIKNDFEEYGIDFDFHIIHQGQEKTFNKNKLTIITMQSLNLMRPSETKILDFIIIDEAHKAKATNFFKLITQTINTQYKLGFTGTFPDNFIDKLIMQSALGPLKHIINSRKLIELGFATDINIVALKLNYSQNDRIELYNKIKETKKTMTEYKLQDLFIAEVSYLNQHMKRLSFITSLIDKVSKKYGNTIALYNNIKYGEKIITALLSKKIKGYVFKNELTKKYLEDFYNKNKHLKIISQNFKPKKNVLKWAEDNNVNLAEIKELNEFDIYLIRGSVDPNTREDIRNLMEVKNNLIIIATVNTMSTGINIKNLHNIVYTQTSKSYIRVVQSIGRLLRKHKSKTLVRFFDIADELNYKRFKNYSFKHFQERINFYIREQHYVTEKELKF